MSLIDCNGKNINYGEIKIEISEQELNKKAQWYLDFKKDIELFSIKHGIKFDMINITPSLIDTVLNIETINVTFTRNLR